MILIRPSTDYRFPEKTHSITGLLFFPSRRLRLVEKYISNIVIIIDKYTISILALVMLISAKRCVWEMPDYSGSHPRLNGEASSGKDLIRNRKKLIKPRR